MIVVVHDKRWKECKGIKIPATSKTKTTTRRRRKGNITLQKSAFLQQTRHLLVFAFPRFSLQTKVPEKVAQISSILELPQRVLNEGRYRRNEVDGIWCQLPSLDVFNDLRGLLPLPEIDQVRSNHVRILVDERQLREEDTCRLVRTELPALKRLNRSPINGTHGATIVESLWR